MDIIGNHATFGDCYKQGDAFERADTYFFSSKSFLADGFLPSPFLVSVVSDLLLGVASDLVNVEEARLFFLSKVQVWPNSFFLFPFCKKLLI